MKPRTIMEPLGKTILVEFAMFCHPPVIFQPLSFYTFSRHYTCSQTWHVCIVLEWWGVCEANSIILCVHDWVIASVAVSLEEIVTK